MKVQEESFILMMELPQIIASISTAMFFVFVGVPVWWQTTKVYRASLPYNEITALAKDNELKIKSKWKIYIDNRIIPNEYGSADNFNKMLSQKMQEGLQKFALELEYFTFDAAKTAFDANIEKFDGNGKTAYELNEILEEYIYKNRSADNAQRNKLFLINSKISLKDSKKCHLVIGSTAFLTLIDTKTVNLQHCLHQSIFNIKRILYPVLDYNLDIGNKQIDNKNGMAASSSATGLEIVFTLANANPFDVIVDWNIEDSISDYLEPFLKEISFFGPHIITSHVLNFVDIGIPPRKSKKKGYFYSEKNLPLLINPLQSRLNEYTSNNPILNFILYVPPASNMPLKIRSKGQNRMSFVSPKWGGVVIKNIGIEVNERNQTHSSENIFLDIREDMKVFVAQFRELIGLKHDSIENVTYSAVDRSSILQYEINYLLLKETITNLEKSTSTLVSLAKLLEKIANIVIRDDIRDLIQAAVSNISESKSFLTDGSLKQAFFSSKAAVSSSEKAFFDHSLLALLYFQDDQKYAIYLPLFLPIGVPVVLSLAFAIRSLIKERNIKTAK